MENKYSVATLLNRMEANWPEAATPETEVALSLIRLHDILQEKTKEILHQSDLTIAGFEVLATLRALPEPRQLTPTELYKSILISSGGMTKILKHLETKGWIERIENLEDGRSKIVKLTEMGKQVTESAMEKVAASDRAVFNQGFSSADKGKFRALLTHALLKVEAD